MNSFNHKKLAELRPISGRYEANCHIAEFPAAQIDLADSTGEKLLGFGFAGFNRLCSSSDTLKIVSSLMKKEEKWAVQGGGLIVIQPGLFTTTTWPKILSKVDVAGMLSAVLGIFCRDFGYEGTGLVIHLPGDELKDNSIAIMATIPVKQRVWQEMYNLRSLEMQAAHHYYLSVGGKMEREADPDNGDLSPHRVLN